MNSIQKLDDWYKEWRGKSHLEESNLQVLDSSDAQDFARYCIDEYKSLVSDVEQSDSNCNIPLVRLSFAELKEAILKYKAKSEYQQAAIVILRNIFKANEA